MNHEKMGIIASKRKSLIIRLTASFIVVLVIVILALVISSLNI